MWKSFASMCVCVSYIYVRTCLVPMKVRRGITLNLKNDNSTYYIMFKFLAMFFLALAQYLVKLRALCTLLFSAGLYSQAPKCFFKKKKSISFNSHFENKLKNSELYISRGWIIWHMNCVSESSFKSDNGLYYILRITIPFI